MYCVIAVDLRDWTKTWSKISVSTPCFNVVLFSINSLGMTTKMLVALLLLPFVGADGTCGKLQTGVNYPGNDLKSATKVCNLRV